MLIKQKPTQWPLMIIIQSQTSAVKSERHTWKHTTVGWGTGTPWFPPLRLHTTHTHSSHNQALLTRHSPSVFPNTQAALQIGWKIILSPVKIIPCPMTVPGLPPFITTVTATMFQVSPGFDSLNRHTDNAIMWRSNNITSDNESLQRYTPEVTVYPSYHPTPGEEHGMRLAGSSNVIFSNLDFKLLAEGILRHFYAGGSNDHICFLKYT